MEFAITFNTEVSANIRQSVISLNCTVKSKICVRLSDNDASFRTLDPAVISALVIPEIKLMAITSICSVEISFSNKFFDYKSFQHHMMAIKH